MKFALIGYNEETPPLIQALLDRGHQLTHTYDAEGISQNLASGAIECEWQALIGSGIDAAVVVARRKSEPVDQSNVLRHLAQMPVALLMVHPVCESITGFELDMIRRDTHAVMASYFPAAAHPALQVMRKFIEEAEPGAIDEVAVERFTSDRSRENILWQLARDAYMLRTINGEINKVTGIRPGETWTNFSVNAAGPGEVLSRWSVLPVEDAPGARVSIRGRGGTLKLDAPDNQPWRISGSGVETEIAFEDWNAADVAVDAFCAEVQGEASPVRWMEACRAQEIAETAEYSVQRGRTINLYLEEHSEQSTFKGVMAAGGCLALLLTLGAFIAALAIDGAQPPFRDQWWWRMWPTYVAAPVVFFLLLQCLQFLFNAKPAESQDNPASNR